MKKGGRRYLVVPSSLAYGSKGFENIVPPNQPLHFEVPFFFFLFFFFQNKNIEK